MAIPTPQYPSLYLRSYYSISRVTSTYHSGCSLSGSSHTCLCLADSARASGPRHGTSRVRLFPQTHSLVQWRCPGGLQYDQCMKNTCQEMCVKIVMSTL